MHRRAFALVVGAASLLAGCFPDEDRAFRADWVEPSAEFVAAEWDREIARFASLEELRAWSPVAIASPVYVPYGIRLQRATVAFLPAAATTPATQAEAWSVVLLFAAGDGTIRHVVTAFPASAGPEDAAALIEERLPDPPAGLVASLLRWRACGADFTMSVVAAPASYLPHARVMAASIARSCDGGG